MANKGYTFDKDNKPLLSSYWLGDVNLDNLDSTGRILKLAAIKRAISNFVRILSPKQIKVLFNTGNKSFSHINTVVISAGADKNLDATVGLSLHETLHIEESDFSILSILKNLIPYIIISTYITKHNLKKEVGEIEVCARIKTLMNIVEDRRIDQIGYERSPGYRGYYHSMYDEYFNNKIIDIGLQSSAFKSENWDSYKFHIINLININIDLNSLKGLKEIYKIIDFKNISRLKSSSDSLQIAIQIFNIIETYTIPREKEIQQPQGNSKFDIEPDPEELPDIHPGKNKDINDDNLDGDDSENQETISGTIDMDNESEENNSEDDNEKTELNKKEPLTEENDDADEGEENSNTRDDESDERTNTKKSDNTEENGQEDEDEKGQDSNSKNDLNDNTEEEEDSSDIDSKILEDLTDKQFDSLIKSIEEQEDFLNGELKKTKISEKENDQISTIEETGTEIKEVGNGLVNKLKVIVINNFTRNLIDSKLFNIFDTSDTNIKYTQECIAKGISIGRTLGNKLQLRNEAKEIKHTRLYNGKIDRRIISSLGYDDGKVFYNKDIEKFKDIYCHISIDASGSMRDGKLHQCILSSVAIAQAASMTKNIHIKIDFRFTSHINSTEMPIVLIAYDSKKDKMTKIISLFKYINANGTTPEGLCFESIQDIIKKSDQNIQSYFINFSDGEPYFVSDQLNYMDDIAIEHTKKQIDIMKYNNIKVLSYFISTTKMSERLLRNFKLMYGRDATVIDVTSVLSLANTLNKKFMEK